MTASNTTDGNEQQDTKAQFPKYDHTCNRCRVIHAATCPVERSREQGEAVMRVSKELRGFLSDAPPDDDDARSILRDCDELDRVAERLLTARTVVL